MKVELWVEGWRIGSSDPWYGYNMFGCAPNSSQLWVGLGGSFSDVDKQWTRIPEAAVRSPAGMIAIGDTAPLGSVIAPVSVEGNFGISLPSRRHASGANVAFCDGHVEYRKQSHWIVASEEVRRRWNIDDEPHPEAWK